MKQETATTPMKRFVVMGYHTEYSKDPNLFFITAPDEDNALEQAYDLKSFSEAEKEYLRTNEEPEGEEEIDTEFLDGVCFEVIELTDSLFQAKPQE